MHILCIVSPCVHNEFVHEYLSPYSEEFEDTKVTIRIIYCKSTNFRLFRGGRQTAKIVPSKNWYKDYLCQSFIVVTSTQHINFSYSLHDLLL